MSNFTDTCVLLTGFTGLIGGEIALSLAREGYIVYVLIRGDDEAHVKIRFSERLVRSRALNTAQIVPLKGDICMKKLGLMDEEYEELARKCHLVIHAAAETRFKACSSILNTNVIGTENMLQFSIACQCLYLFIYISSASVVTSPNNSIICDNACHKGYANNYVKSKREAETAVVISNIPYCIVRPSIVSPYPLRDREFSRAMCWFIPFAARERNLNFSGEERLDIITCSQVAAGVTRLCGMKKPPRFCNLSAGQGSAVRLRRLFECGLPDMYEEINYNKTEYSCIGPLGLYAPFIHANVVYDNTLFLQLMGWSSVDIVSPETYIESLLSNLNECDIHLGWRTA